MRRMIGHLVVIGTTLWMCSPLAARADLVSWWRFDGNAGDPVSGNAGGLFGTPAYVPGKYGKGLQFSTSADGVNVPDANSLKITKSITIRASILISALPSTSDNYGTIVFRGDSRYGNDPYHLTLQWPGKLEFNIDGVSASESVEAPAPPTGQFVTVMGTLDDSTGRMALYVDDILVAEKTTIVRPFADLDPNSNPGLSIGNHTGLPGSPHIHPFHGIIDDVKLYNDARGPADFQPKLIVQNKWDARIALLTLKGTSVVQSVTTIPKVSDAWQVVATGDFNLDGRDDIVVQNVPSRAISILYMAGNRVTASISIHPILPSSWSVVAAADFTGDARPEIVAQEVTSGRIAVLSISGNRFTSSVPLSNSPPASWRVVGAADLDGDLNTDIVLQNLTTRQVSILTLLGKQVISSIPLMPNLPAD